MGYKYLLGLFDDEVPLLHAVRRIREANVDIHDVLTPFPVHGLEHELGLKETKLHTAGFIFGAIGFCIALFGMSWVTNISWPNNIGGKPNWPIPAFIPVTFELTVLCSCVGMVVVYYFRNKLSIWSEPEIIDPRITDDRFVMVFSMEKYGHENELNEISNILKNAGAVEVREQEMNERVLSSEDQTR